MVTPAKFPTVTDLPVRRWKSVDFPVLVADECNFHRRKFEAGLVGGQSLNEGNCLFLHRTSIRTWR